jgi:hypothetical protein
METRDSIGPQEEEKDDEAEETVHDDDVGVPDVGDGGTGTEAGKLRTRG